MEYNTKRQKLIIPEYGRHVQKMVAHAVGLKDKKDRKKCVDAIISFMGQMNPHLRDIKEFTHKLWDHLFIMSNFELEVDSPYPAPEVEKLQARPEKLGYAKNKIKFPFYGINLQNMIQLAIDMDPGDEKKFITGMIANHMKKSYLIFNKDSVDNKTILVHLEKLSKGLLKVPEDFEFIDGDSVLKPKRSQSNHQRKRYRKRR